nr:MAG TPA: hypothetical protein [Caudoviricetes sp.]
MQAFFIQRYSNSQLLVYSWMWFDGQKKSPRGADWGYGVTVIH